MLFLYIYINSSNAYLSLDNKRLSVGNNNNNTKQKKETRVINFDFLVSFSIVCLLWFVDSVNWNPSPSVSFQFKFSIQFSLDFDIIVSDYNWFDFSFLFHVINFVFSIYIWINRNPIFYESQVCCTFPFPSLSTEARIFCAVSVFWNWIYELFYFL